ncbi:MAG: phosphatase PAP2 family protein [Bacillota bacterium]
MKKIAETIINKDIKLFYLINGKLKCRFLDYLMPYLTNLGGALFTINFTLLFMFFGSDKFQKVGFEALLALASSGIVVQAIKFLFKRKRPYLNLEHVNLIKKPFCLNSFPSGHTTAAFSLAIVIGSNFPSFSLVSNLLASIVGVSRAYIGVHYPSDIFMGATIGIYFSNYVHTVL